MLKIFHKILPDDFDYSNQDHLYTLMPENIKAILSEKKSKKRMLSLIGWKLLLDNLPDSALLAKVAFEEKGKPFIPNSNIHFNISNTKGIVVLALHNKPVGIDVEQLRKQNEIIFPRVFCEDEIQSITCSEDFTILWTRKEAVVKLFGGGISMGLTNFSVLDDCIDVFGRKVRLSSVNFVGFISHLAFYD